MLVLFTATLFLSATLLFQVQPLFAKMLLPKLGGTPAVWNTCVVFFELALVAGYLYSHLTVKWLGVRRQAMLHIGLLLLPLAALPIRINDAWALPTSGNPIGPVFLLLLVSVGLPFFVVSTSAPLLQRWLGATTHPAARDPYFLYAASNVGSLLALLTYPTLVEPTLRLTTQSRVWTAGYGLLVILIAACAWTMRRSLRDADGVGTRDANKDVEHNIGHDVRHHVGHDVGHHVGHHFSGADGAADAPAPPISWVTRLHWLALSAVPSSLMLSTTTYITSDVAAVPLLWVIPLAIYLLTFVLVFARRQILPHQWVSMALPLAIIPTYLVIAKHDSAALTTIPALLLMLFVAAMACHGELARLRPPAANLTDFYLTMSIGGALGGLFNVLVAPQVFTSAAEFPIGVVLACMLRPTFSVFSRSGSARASSLGDRSLDIVLPLMLGVIAVVLKVSGEATKVDEDSYWGLAHVYALPVAIWLTFWSRPVRLGLGLAAMIFFTRSYAERGERILHEERSYFGIYQIKERNRSIQLNNGTTIHGLQLKDPTNKCLPLTYYYPSGPVGQLFNSFTGAHAKSNIAIVGLGAGSMAGYTRPNEKWTFYEIDPAIERIAMDGRYFTYLKGCGDDVRVVLGDARLTLGQVPDGTHDVIVLDAFTSDSVPVHLLTREAMAIYFRKLGPGGVLAVHISNRFLDLQPSVSAVVHDLGLVGYNLDDGAMTREERAEGKFESTWVVVARAVDDLGDLLRDMRWIPVSNRPDVRPWTDDFSNVFSAVKW